MFLVLVLQLYYHGESIAVNVHLTNRSSKTVKKVRITGRGDRLFVRPDFRLVINVVNASS